MVKIDSKQYYFFKKINSILHQEYLFSPKDTELKTDTHCREDFIGSAH